MSKEPRGELARYAFGYSDRKPGIAWWLIHGAMVAFVALTALGITGCQRADTSVARGGTTEGRRGGLDYLSTGRAAQVVVDRDTGCQYWMAYGNRAMTPRYAWGPSGLYVVGCK